MFLCISHWDYHVSSRQNEVRKGTDFVLVFSSEAPVNQGPFRHRNTSIWRQATVSPLILLLLSKIPLASSNTQINGISFEAHRAGLAFLGFVWLWLHWASASSLLHGTEFFQESETKQYELATECHSLSEGFPHLPSRVPGMHLSRCSLSTSPASPALLCLLEAASAKMMLVTQRCYLMNASCVTSRVKCCYVTF